jgi:hypothetical protein
MEVFMLINKISKQKPFAAHVLLLSVALCCSSLGLAPQAHAQVVGAPVGGTTGAGGNAGVGDYDAGDNRSDTYDAPANPMSSTTSGTHHKPRHHAASDSVNPNKSNNADAAQVYSNPSGTAPAGALAPVPGAAGGGSTGASSTGR